MSEFEWRPLEPAAQLRGCDEEKVVEVCHCHGIKVRIAAGNGMRETRWENIFSLLSSTDKARIRSLARGQNIMEARRRAGLK